MERIHWKLEHTRFPNRPTQRRIRSPLDDPISRDTDCRHIFEKDPPPGRSGGYKLGTSGIPGQDLDVTLAYDTSGRLSGVNSGAGSFSYGYVTNSELLSTLTGPQISTTYAYEPNRDVRTEVLNQIGTTAISRYGYRSDGIARRKDRVKEGTAFSAGVYDRFAYNDRNEVTLTRNYTGTNPDGASDPETVALARQFSYDAIGNRLTSQSGTSSVRGYTSNALNQYTALTNPSASPVHDLDGNQTQSGTGWYYEWDAENRLTLARDYATSPVNGSKKLEFTYDYQSRRIRKIESSYVSSAWTVLDDRKFIYEGWNLLGEFATSGFARICAYTWGLDLSQTHQGAGGVGGLLAVTTTTPSTATFFATYDGNGNVSEYISSTGGIEAHFEYDAFGELSASTGSNLGRFSHRFSSKYWDDSTGFYYYGFRCYNPSTGRWPNRDPLDEKGGGNLYGMARNDTVNQVDPLGLEIFGGGSGSAPYGFGPIGPYGPRYEPRLDHQLILVPAWDAVVETLPRTPTDAIKYSQSRTVARYGYLGVNLEFSVSGRAEICCDSGVKKMRFTGRISGGLYPHIGAELPRVGRHSSDRGVGFGAAKIEPCGSSSIRDVLVFGNLKLGGIGFQVEARIASYSFKNGWKGPAFPTALARLGVGLSLGISSGGGSDGVYIYK